MTFCVGIKVRGGLVALADTQIVRGSEQVSKQKLSFLSHTADSLFVMTSGLRSVRDKSLTYLREQLDQHQQPIDRLYKVVNLFGEQLRKVREEDSASLSASGLSWNPHAIIGGQFHQDLSPQLLYVYPEGNWIESVADSPYFIIGRTHYGKPILDRLLTFETPLLSAVALALLAFDATRTSVTDVDCPIDVAVIAEGDRHAKYQRFSANEIYVVTQWWSDSLSQSLASMPMGWAANLFQSAG
jgi:putative proteasome-type protease